MRARFVNERMNFERGGNNPLKNLGIGKIKRIEDWLLTNTWQNKSDFLILDNYTIAAPGDIVCHGKIEKFPDFIQFADVHGNFICAHCGLINLKGCPISCFNFNCSYNQLTDLEGCPQEVDGIFLCKNNLKYFTEEYVKSKSNVQFKIFV